MFEIETSFWVEESNVRKPTLARSVQLSKMAPILSQDFENLTILALIHDVTPSELLTGRQWRRLDLSVLHGLDLPRLHTLESHVKILGITPDCFTEWASVKRCAQQETAMLGMKLIGRHGKLLSNEFGSRPQATFRCFDQQNLVCVWTLREDAYRQCLRDFRGIKTSLAILERGLGRS